MNEPSRMVKFHIRLKQLNRHLNTVSKSEIAITPKPEEVIDHEWQRLIKKGVWSYDEIYEWNDVANHSRENGKSSHLGRIFGIMVEKGFGPPKNDKRRNFKYSVVFQANNVVDQNWEVAVFQDLGSEPASM